MGTYEAVFVWVSISIYGAGFLLYLSGLVFKKEKHQRWGYAASLLGFGFHTAAIAARWIVTGHPPVMATYENALMGTWVMMLTYIIMSRVFPPAKAFGVAVLPLALLILGNGVQTGGVLRPLEPPYRSPWLYIHVLFAWFAFGSFVTAFATGGMYLLKTRSSKGVLSRLPELKVLDELSLRLILFGFFAMAVTIVCGAIWARSLWGRYWGWDPVETWSLISWLIYGLNLHLRITMGWRGKRAAWLAIVSLVGVGCLFFGVGFVSNLHTGIF